MGIRKPCLELITKYTQHISSPKIMVELGDQMFRQDIGVKSAKDYFTAQGWTHISIDLNGFHGAIPLDLSTVLRERYNADVVTNFGTSEHVGNQYNCFKNIHNFTKVGGLMLHAVPEVGYWPHHGLYHYENDFFNILSTANKYTIVAIDTVIHPQGETYYLPFVVLKKEDDSPFSTDMELLEHIKEVK